MFKYYSDEFWLERVVYIATNAGLNTRVAIKSSHTQA
jgi:hypothetical protein